VLGGTGEAAILDQRLSLPPLLRGGKHQFGHVRPVVGANAVHILREKTGVHRDFRMIVRPQQIGAFQEIVR
jgi:hypothetical protein